MHRHQLLIFNITIFLRNAEHDASVDDASLPYCVPLSVNWQISVVFLALEVRGRATSLSALPVLLQIRNWPSGWQKNVTLNSNWPASSSLLSSAWWSKELSPPVNQNTFRSPFSLTMRCISILVVIWSRREIKNILADYREGDWNPRAFTFSHLRRWFFFFLPLSRAWWM